MRPFPAVCFTLALFTASSARADIYQDFARSLAQWNELNRAHDLEYSINAVFKSWTGIGHNTLIDVDSDRVVQRSFERWIWYYDYEDEGAYKQEIVETWIEDAEHIGEHSEGEPAKNMDQIYAECAADVLSRHPRQFVIDFTTDADGLLKTCRARDIYCADDCWEGIAIEELKIK